MVRGCEYADEMHIIHTHIPKHTFTRYVYTLYVHNCRSQLKESIV